MIPEEVYRIKYLLDSFLGESKSDLTESYQLEYPCPRCVEKYGNNEIRKYNLSVTLVKGGGLFNCWKCSDEDDHEMHGTIVRLIKLYGNEKIMKEYKSLMQSLRESKLYKINLSADDVKMSEKAFESEMLEYPKTFRTLSQEKYHPMSAIEYLSKRGIGWDIIDRFNIGCTEYVKDDYMVSNRIFIPSYDKYGDLNYWTGRDYVPNSKRVKYFNPKVERKSIIFNEEKIQWDADITLVEGPFDHIVVPNSVPLLGKVLDKDFKLYWEIQKNANSNILIFLDGDAGDDVKKIYKSLNHGKLYGKIRYIPVKKELDPSKLYELYGPKGIIESLKNASKIDEMYLG